MNRALIAIGNAKAKAGVKKWDDELLRQHDKYQTIDEFRKAYELSDKQLYNRYQYLRDFEEYADLFEKSKSPVMD